MTPLKGDHTPPLTQFRFQVMYVTIYEGRSILERWEGGLSSLSQGYIIVFAIIVWTDLTGQPFLASCKTVVADEGILRGIRVDTDVILYLLLFHACDTTNPIMVK